MSRRTVIVSFLIVVFLLAACSDDAAVESTGEQEIPTEDSTATSAPDTGEPEPEVLTVDAGQSPFAEPDLGFTPSTEEISEDPAGEPTEVILDADPDDGDDVAQAGLAAGESALCATIQIGLDAVNDGAEELAQSQRSKLIDGADALADRQLVALVTSMADEPLTEVDVLADALDRCTTLGFER